MEEGFKLFCHLSFSSFSRKKMLFSQKSFNFLFTEKHHLVSPMLEVELIGEKVSAERVCGLEKWSLRKT